VVGNRLKTLDIIAFAVNAALYVAAGILFFSVLPLSFGQVRFWPQVVIPAVFAVVFGPWVGGLGAALGIFVNDLVLNNNPVLSLMAGVTANFAAFWIIGYIAKKKPDWKLSVLAYGVVTALLVWIAYVYTDIIYVGIVIVSYAFFLVVAVSSIKNSKWQSYEIGCVTGLLIGSAIIGLMVPVYLQFFAPSATALTFASVFAYFIWTFTTEIPFLIILGPPIIWAIHKAFPRFKIEENQGKNSE
jgi:uncharacterized Tic20 family protein